MDRARGNFRTGIATLAAVGLLNNAWLPAWGAVAPEGAPCAAPRKDDASRPPELRGRIPPSICAGPGAEAAETTAVAGGRLSEAEPRTGEFIGGAGLLEASKTDGLEAGRLFDGSTGRADAVAAVVAAGPTSPAAQEVAPSAETTGPEAAGARTPLAGIEKLPRASVDGRELAVKTAGTVSAGAVSGVVSYLIWGLPAAAYYFSGYAVNAVYFALYALRNRPLARRLGVAFEGDAPPTNYAVVSKAVRASAGGGLLALGILTANPGLSTFGVAFTLMGVGGLLSKIVSDAALKKLKDDSPGGLGARLHRLLQADQTPPAAQGAPSEKKSLPSRAGDFLSKHRVDIVRQIAAGLAGCIPAAIFGGGVQFVMSQWLGQAVHGSLSVADQAHDMLVEGYAGYRTLGFGLEAQIHGAVCSLVDRLARRKGPTVERNKKTVPGEPPVNPRSA